MILVAAKLQQHHIKSPCGPLKSVRLPVVLQVKKRTTAEGDREGREEKAAASKSFGF